MQDIIDQRLKKSQLVDSAGLDYKTFRPTLQPQWWRVWLDIAIGWMLLLMVQWLFFLTQGNGLLWDVLLTLFIAFISGFLIAYLQLFIHEAAHYNIHPNRTFNDYLCNVFVSGILGQDVRLYRPIHFEHHRHLGTTKDSEISYFEALTPAFLVQSLTGFRLIKIFLHRRRKQDQLDAPKANAPRLFPWVLIGGGLANLAYLSVLMYYGSPLMAIGWVLAVFVFYPFFGSLRQLVEHRSATARTEDDYYKIDHGATHRLFSDSLFARLFGGAGFSRHLLHHWDMQVSYTRLEELEDYLMDTDAKAYLNEHRTSYSETFFQLLRQGMKVDA